MIAVENVNMTPATSPHPSAAVSVVAWIGVLMPRSTDEWSKTIHS